MAACAGAMISPSEQVDQVWHLHMTYTYEYREFCKKILKKEYIHNPSSGGKDDKKKFDEIYISTLDFYKEVFMMDAPTHIWEDVS
jgi:hypothetical protein